MGIYSTTHSAVNEAALSIDGINISESTLDMANYTAMGFEIVAENEANYNKIMQAIGISELAYYEEHGEEIVYEGGGLAGFFEAIKNFFIKLGNKIKELFQKFVAWIASKTSDTSKFIKKYADQAKEKWSKIKDSFSIKGYDFANIGFDADGVETAAVDMVCKEYGFKSLDLKNIDFKAADDLKDKDTLKSVVGNVNDGDVAGFIRAKLVAQLSGKSASDALSASEFSAALNRIFRGGTDAPIEITKDKINLDEVISRLEGYKDAKTKADKAYKSLKTSLDKAVASAQAAEKKARGLKADAFTAVPADDEEKGKSLKTELVAYVSAVVKANKDIKNELVTAGAIYLQNLKDQASQDKKIIAKIITAGGKKVEKEEVEESASVATDFLKNIVLV